MVAEYTKLNGDLLKAIAVGEAEARRIESEGRRKRGEVDRLKRIAAKLLDESGKPEAKRGLFRVAWEATRGRIAWKEEAVRRMTPEELDQLEASVPAGRRLVVTQAA